MPESFELGVWTAVRDEAFVRNGGGIELPLAQHLGSEDVPTKLMS